MQGPTFQGITGNLSSSGQLAQQEGLHQLQLPANPGQYAHDVIAFLNLTAMGASPFTPGARGLQRHFSIVICLSAALAIGTVFLAARSGYRAVSKPESQHEAAP